MFEMRLSVPQIPAFTDGASAAVVADEQKKAMAWAVLRAKSEIVPLINSNTGLYAKSIMTMIYGESMSLIGRVFTPLSYPLALEGGATWPNNPPPIGPLRLWAQRRFGVDEGEATSIAWAVRRTLVRRGLAARHYFEGGYLLARQAILDNWSRMADRIAKRLGGGS